MLITMKEILTVAKENQFAVGAFNVADSTFLTLISVIFSQNKPTPRHFTILISQIYQT